MPYKSKAQQGYMHAAAQRGGVPKAVVADFDKASKGRKDLPEHVKQHLASGGEACMSCGGMGYAEEPEPDDNTDGAALEPMPSFAGALKERHRGY